MDCGVPGDWNSSTTSSTNVVTDTDIHIQMISQSCTNISDQIQIQTVNFFRRIWDIIHIWNTEANCTVWNVKSDTTRASDNYDLLSFDISF